MLVDFRDAKESLDITHDDQDLKVQRELDEAEALVIDYIKRPEHGWTVATVPRHVRSAILHVLRRIHDDPMGELPGGPMPDFVKDMLWRERDPAIA